MGLNVIVENPDAPFEERYHPDWDDLRYSGDRELFAIMKAVPGEYRDVSECDWVWRPTDFAAFRAAAWPEVNTERWSKLADILEADSRYWIYMSI